jgi:DNA-binding response OmpR family regulator/putative methionine-R-sulfoxide reductase with GAF domain
MPKELILIIDDSKQVRRFLRDLLEPLDYEVSTAATGEEGLAKALAGPPDLIMLDLNLPGMSGLQVVRALKQHDCQVPVILMTLFGSQDIVLQALRLGARDYLDKPFDIKELMSALERALEEGRLRRDRERLLAELSKTNRRMTRQMRELATLQAIGRSVASLMPRETLIRRILDAAIYLGRAQVGALFLLDEDSNELRLEAIRQGDVYSVGLQAMIADSHVEDVLRSGRPLHTSGPTKRTGVTTYLGQKAQSLLYVPVKLGGSAIGVMGVAWLSGSDMPSEMQDRLVALADYAAIALKNAQLYEDSQRQAQQLSTVNRIARTTVSSLELEETVKAVVRSLREGLHVQAASLVLLDEESNELIFEVMPKDTTEQPKRLHKTASPGIVGWVVQNKQSLRVNDLSQEPHFHPEIDRGSGLRAHSILCVPLTIANKVIGAIEAINKLDDQAPGGLGQFSDWDEKMLTGAAAFVAMAVENARLHEATRHTVAAQTVHDTVVTLSHHVSNPLQVLMGVLDMLRSDLDDGCTESFSATQIANPTDHTLAQATEVMERELQEISVAMSVLQDISSPESTLYLGTIQMLDIEEEFQARLESVAGQPMLQVG